MKTLHFLQLLCVCNQIFLMLLKASLSNFWQFCLSFSLPWKSMEFTFQNKATPSTIIKSRQPNSCRGNRSYFLFPFDLDFFKF